MRRWHTRFPQEKESYILEIIQEHAQEEEKETYFFAHLASKYDSLYNSILCDQNMSQLGWN